MPHGQSRGKPEKKKIQIKIGEFIHFSEIMWLGLGEICRGPEGDRVAVKVDVVQMGRVNDQM